MQDGRLPLASAECREPNPETAAAKKWHAELLVAWMKMRAEIYDYLVETLIIDGSR